MADSALVMTGGEPYYATLFMPLLIYEEAFDYVDAPIIRVAQKEVPLPYNRTLEQAALPQVPDIIAAVKEVLK